MGAVSFQKGYLSQIGKFCMFVFTDDRAYMDSFCN